VIRWRNPNWRWPHLSKTLTAKIGVMNPLKSAITFYRVCSIITGTALILVTFEVVLNWGFGLVIWGDSNWLRLVPKGMDGSGLPTEGIDVSKLLLQIHGLLYVIYLFADFRVWRLAQLSFQDFLIIASGGIIPFSSFFIEGYYHKRLLAKAGA